MTRRPLTAHLLRFDLLGHHGQWSQTRRFWDYSWDRPQRGWGCRRRYGRARDDGEEEGWERFEVVCASAGRVTVDILNTRALVDGSTPLIVYLPPRGSDGREEVVGVPAFLRGLPFNSAFARINYRWGVASSSRDAELGGEQQTSEPLSPLYKDRINPFPTPLHDTLAAYDFLTKTYLPSFNLNSTSEYPTPPSSPNARPLPRPIVLAGSFLGGTLATSLALTSTYASTKQATVRVAGLVTQNAVFDWTHVASSMSLGGQEPGGIDDGATVTSSTKMPSAREAKDKHHWDTSTLHGLKTRLFPNPQSAFDHFASPVLFFHTPAFVVPAKWPGTEAPLETNRYSTSISPEDDLTSEAVEEDVAGDGERGEAEIIGALPASKPGVTKKVKRKTTPASKYVPETARLSYLKFPPNNTPTSNSSFSRYADSATWQPQLKIPRSLFLYSLDACEPSPSSSKPSTSEPSSTPVKSERKSAEHALEDVTPEKQAKEMARLMRRSVLMVECKERTLWDEGFDAHGVANERVRALGLGEMSDEEQADHESGVTGTDEEVRHWLEECLE